MTFSLREIGFSGLQFRIHDASGRKVGIVYCDRGEEAWTVAPDHSSPGSPFASMNEVPDLLRDASFIWFSDIDAVRRALCIEEAELCLA